MGRVIIGADNTKDTIRVEEPTNLGQALLKGLQEAVEAKEVIPTIIEVPVERIIEIIKEIPVIQIVEKIVEVPGETIIKEVIVEKRIEVPIEIIKEVIIEKEVRVVDIEPLLKEREQVRFLKRSNAIYRALFILLLGASLTIIGVMHG